MLRLRKSSGNARLWRALLIVIGQLAASINLAHADVYYPIGHWRAFATLGGGGALTSNLGRTTTLPDPLTGGVNVYNANHGVLTAGAIDGFFGLELGFHPMWGFAIGLGYNQTSSFGINSTGIQGRGTPLVNSFGYQYRVIARQYLAEGKVLYNLRGCYHPYVELGLGVSQNAALSYQTSSVALLSQPQFENQTSSSFSYNAGIGIDYDVLCNVRLGLGYRFADFGKVELGNAIANPGFVGKLSQSDFYVHELLAEITFIF